MGPAVDRFRVAVAEAALTHDGWEVLARYVANARIRTNAAGHPIIEKVEPSRLIDACVAAVLAFEARAQQMPLEDIRIILARVRGGGVMR